MTYSPLKVYQRFGEKCCLHLQCRIINQARNQKVAASCIMLVSFLAYSSALKLRWHVTPKRWMTFNGLQGVISQKINLFITSAVWLTFSLTAAYRLHRSLTEIRYDLCTYFTMPHRASGGSSGCHCIYGWENFSIRRSFIICILLFISSC
jgi:hypothetical protein